MGTIPESDAYTDATVLNPTTHNKNVYSGTGTEGLMSEANGGISSANLHADFEVLAEHILPFSFVFAAQRRAARTRHYYSDICGDSQGITYICLDAARFRLPFDAAEIRIMASFFVSPWLWNGGAQGSVISARTELFFDGEALAETAHLLPTAADSTASITAYRNEVGRHAVMRSYTLLITDDADITRDDHELSLRLYMEDDPVETDVVTGDNAKLHGRVSISNVSIIVMAFKKENAA